MAFVVAFAVLDVNCTAPVEVNLIVLSSFVVSVEDCDFGDTTAVSSSLLSELSWYIVIASRDFFMTLVVFGGTEKCGEKQRKYVYNKKEKGKEVKRKKEKKK